MAQQSPNLARQADLVLKRHRRSRKLLQIALQRRLHVLNLRAAPDTERSGLRSGRLGGAIVFCDLSFGPLDSSPLSGKRRDQTTGELFGNYDEKAWTCAKLAPPSVSTCACRTFAPCRRPSSQRRTAGSNETSRSP